MFDDQPASTPKPPQNLPAEPEDMFDTVEAPAPSPAPGAPNAIAAGLLKKKEPMGGLGTSMPPMPAEQRVEQPVEYSTKGPILGKILLFVVILLALGVLGVGGWWVYRTYIAKPTTITTTTTDFVPPEINPVASPAVEIPSTNNVTATATTTPPFTTATSGTGETGSVVQTKNILFGDQADSDNDGLPDDEEIKLGTDPHNPDTDGDGLLDGEEVTVYGTNPLLKDTDNDGLNDFDEVKIWHTNPLNPDTDGDGFSDGTEVRSGYNPLGQGKLFNVPTGTVATSTTATTTKTTTTKK